MSTFWFSDAVSTRSNCSVCMIIAVSLAELRRARCYDDDSQHDDICSPLDSDSELSLPPRKVGPLFHINSGCHCGLVIACSVAGMVPGSNHIMFSRCNLALVSSCTAELGLTQHSTVCGIVK